MQLALEALAHPGRREMLQLMSDEEVSVGELAERAGMRQPAASQHLRVLREAGLVRTRAVGQRRLYRVDAAAVERLRAELDAFWGPRLDSLRAAAEADA